MSVNLDDKIQPIDIEAKINNLRSRYCNTLNPQEQDMVPHYLYNRL